MNGNSRRTRITRSAFALLALFGLAISAGCSGHTTGATDIKRQPNGTYSAKLNVVGSCDKGSATTPCSAYTQWRKVGTTTWTKGPTVTIPKKVTDKHTSQTATGLAPNTTYEYQVCGKEFDDKSVACSGDRTGSNAKFGTGGGFTAGGQTTNQAGASKPGSRTAAPKPTNGASQVSSSGGGGEGTSPLVPIAIAVGAGVLILGGTWWTSRRFLWSRKERPDVATAGEVSDVQRSQAEPGQATSAEARAPATPAAEMPAPETPAAEMPAPETPVAATPATETLATERLAPKPTIAPAQRPSGGAGGGGTSPVRQIAIAVGAGALLVGGARWAAKRFRR